MVGVGEISVGPGWRCVLEDEDKVPVAYEVAARASRVSSGR